MLATPPQSRFECRDCPSRSDSPPACHDCLARNASEPPRRCRICDGEIRDPQYETCHSCAFDGLNGLRWGYSRNRAILFSQRVVYEAIKDFKYRRMLTAGDLLERVLVGYLAANTEDLEEYDYIMATPWFRGDGNSGARFDHMDDLMQRAASRLPSLPLPDCGSIIQKVRATPSLAGKTRDERWALHEEFVAALQIPHDAAGLDGHRILVVDDLFTSGVTLDAVATVLRRAGAESVSGLSIIRQARDAAPLSD